MRHGAITAVIMLAGLAAPLSAWAAEDGSVRPKLPGEVAPVPEVAQAEAAARDSRAWIGDLRQQVQACWNQPKGGAVVTVAFEMNRDGTVVDDSLRSIPREMADTGSFMTARRAILRCSRTGFDLPADQYDVWRNIEMTFDPVVEGEQ
ncbi:hypothetical protein FIU85_07020 [Roseovarius sp. THAF8]|uniref:cell envelope integrity protein TolA n=1 Tax=Roseovarius sp. THAF8 TaxID=2587846 RepID=UPI0012680696|nr:cell envelope integrity protein TolA [Roseovarius sp. THAF8]QFT97048.1 hypothetical protein FIU85_07020 [Roseovarius sp. THAF8]